MISKWLILTLIVVVIILSWVLYPANKRVCNNEGYDGWKGCRTFNPMRLYNASDPWVKGSFVVHPDDMAWYNSTVEFPAYLCNGGQRYCYGQMD